MQVSDEKTWAKSKENNKDAYGGGVISYAQRWAELMEAEIAKGQELEDIAERTSHEADTEGITGFMFGAAVSTLHLTWKHGERLRIWHNLKTQIGDEGIRANEKGGILNPAIMEIVGWIRYAFQPRS